MTAANLLEFISDKIRRFEFQGVMSHTLIAFALSLLLSLVPTESASASPIRSDSQNEAVYFVHGYSRVNSTDCVDTWNTAVLKFQQLGWKGPLRSVGFYKNDTRCGVIIDRATYNTSHWEIARKLAWAIYWRESQYGRSVDLVGHSMGGLIIRAAVHGSRTKPKGSYASGGWPPYIYVEDAVTLGAPHKGTGGLVSLCNYVTPTKQCLEMETGSPFLKELATYPNPQAEGGTDWTLIASAADRTAGTTSGLGMSAGHFVSYDFYQVKSGAKGTTVYTIDHTELRRNVSGHDLSNYYWNYYDRVWRRQDGTAASTIETTKNALYYWRWW
jgi:Lipase (class 2)